MKTEVANEQLFLLDGHAICYRAFYAIKGMSTSKGQATNAVYGFINTLKKILRDYEPAYMAVCFDSPEKTHREEKFAEYKIQRAAMPDDLISQIPIIKEVLAAYNVPIFELGGFEADDMIATISQSVKKKDLEVVIVSEDKDLYQLVKPNVKFFSARKDVILGESELKDLLGFEPHQINDFVGLAGDKVDNIPGVMGIGEVTARKLINKFGTLENILDNLDDIEPAKVKEKIMAQQKEAVLSKELAILDTKAPFKFDLKQMKMKEPNRDRLLELFKELEFRRLSEEMMPAVEVQSATAVTQLAKKEDLDKLVKKILKVGQCSFLFDALVKDKKDVLVEEGGVYIVIEKGGLYYVEVKDFKSLKPVFEDKKLFKIIYDFKGALRILASQNIVLATPVFDVMLAAALLGSAQNAIKPSDLAWQYLKQSIGKDDIAQGAEVLIELFVCMKKELKEKSLEKLLNDIELPLAQVLFEMESEGVHLDAQLLLALSKDCESKIQGLTKKLYKQAQEEFNLNSPKQLGRILFEKLELPVIKKTKTGFSTDEGVLTKLAENHEFPSLILEYRQLAKLKSTYIDALPKLIHPKTNRIHAEFNQVGAETGRLSSRHPNLQNIPIRTELGRQIRKAFIPSVKTREIIAADYSQIELRILAHLSDDKNLIKAFMEDQDIHRYTASLMFDVEQEEVDAKMRDSAKRVNFGIVYGMSAFGLSKDLKISQGEAQEFIDKYFLRYPNVKYFMDDEIQKCEAQGFVSTLLNRRRYIPEINSPNRSIQQFAQRQAINTPVQGSAADLIKLAMINVQAELKKKKFSSKMLITVHDELVFDVEKDEKEDLIDLIRDLMEHPLELSVPLKVTVKTGKNWLDMNEVVSR